MNQMLSTMSTKVFIVEKPSPERPLPVAFSTIRAQLEAVHPDGRLLVGTEIGEQLLCEWLETGLNDSVRLRKGDLVLVSRGQGDAEGIVLGRIGRYQEPGTQRQVTIEAQESVTLKCGDSSVDLRADGKLMIRGEDVLVRAKGTQRIRAGTVSIN